MKIIWQFWQKSTSFRQLCHLILLSTQDLELSTSYPFRRHRRRRFFDRRRHKTYWVHIGDSGYKVRDAMIHR